MISRDLHKGIAGWIRRHRMITTIVIAFVLIKASFRKFNFDPTRDFPTVKGYALDLGIWMLVCLIIYWSMGRIFPPKIS